MNDQCLNCKIRKWCSSFGEKETDESKAVKKVLDEIENRLDQFMVTGNKKQEAAEVQM